MFLLEFLQDILAAIGVVLNGIPQGLLALSYGFASVPTALGFAIGAVGCGVLNSVAPHFVPGRNHCDGRQHGQKQGATAFPW